MQNIVFIGMPGCGKSTVGAKLAKNLHMRLIDTDRLIVEKTGKSLPQLLRELGVDGFLQLEGNIGAQLVCDRCVIATGGSMVFSEAAMNHLKKGAVVVWLDTELPELEKRIRRNADRGIAAEPGTSLKAIDSLRRPLYEKYADLHVQTAGGVGHVVQQLTDQLATFGFHTSQP